MAKFSEMQRERRGLRCPECGGNHLRTHKTRRQAGKVTRIRICRDCDARITTCEKVSVTKKV